MFDAANPQGGTALLPNEDTSAKNRFGPECRRPSREGNDAMNAENVRINLRYDQADLKSLLRYAKAHDIERGGRYDILGFIRAAGRNHR
jgi:hypothetical protein